MDDIYISKLSVHGFKKQYQVPVMSRGQRWVFRFLVGWWLVSLVWFWGWWFQDEHVVGLLKMTVNSLVLFWTMVVPGYFFYFVGRMRKPNPALALSKDWRVAMVVTKAPSEPWAVVRKTLEAMLQQPYPHDTWLADEDPAEDTVVWCAKHGVQISSRKGVKQYHRTSWPRRTKCKEGNLAYFYDTYGYAQYDVVVQLDADHVPEKGYLKAMLRPFIDPLVGYVSAPSICDANAAASWAARGRLFAEASMHGPLQAGYSAGWAPLCIGSHYAVRTTALREIGGLGPELAEDHSTTLMMNAHGWKGVHAFEAMAHGDGPMTLADCVVQEFQWARSLVVVLLTELPRYWGHLPLRLKFEFAFGELWYPLFGMTMLIGHLIPVGALLLKEPLVAVSYVDFVLRALPVTSSLIAAVMFLKINGWLRPVDAKVLSWEGVLFQIIRWPWALYGSVAGVWVSIRKTQLTFRVTPKGETSLIEFPWRLLWPYALVVLVSFLSGVLLTDVGRARGYYYFLILNCMVYGMAMLGLVVIHYHEAEKLSKQRV